MKIFLFRRSRVSSGWGLTESHHHHHRPSEDQIDVQQRFSPSCRNWPRCVFNRVAKKLILTMNLNWIYLIFCRPLSMMWSPFLIIPKYNFLHVSILSKGLYAWNVFLKDEKCLFIQFSEVKCQINAKCISLSLSRGISHHHTTHCTGHHFISKSAKKNMFLHSYHAYSTHFVYFNFQFWIFYCSIS